MEITETILNRRSIRKMKTTPVNEDDLKKILEAARWAPSWGNTQCWRLIVVRKKETRIKLAETLFSFQRPDPARPNSTGQAIIDAPILIAVCAELDKAGCRADGEALTDKEGYWYMFDTALAMQNLVLEAHSLGLGTVIIGAFDSLKAGEILELPEGYCVVAMTPLGYPDQEPKAPPRKELSDIVFNDKFGG